MRDRLTVRLPEDLFHALKAASHRTRRKTSEIVRLALREFLVPPSHAGATAAERVQGLIGSLESGTPDLAEKHRAYVIESARGSW